MQNGHEREISSSAISPDGRFLATAGNQFDYAEILIWDIKSGLIFRRIPGHTKSIGDLCFASNGRLLSCSDDKSVKLWDVISGDLIYNIYPDRGASHLSVYGNGTKAICAQYDKIHLLDLETGTITKTLTGFGLQRDIACTEDGLFFFTTDDSSVVKINAQTGARSTIYTSRPYCDKLICHGKLLLISCLNEWVVIDTEGSNMFHREKYSRQRANSCDLNDEQVLIVLDDSILHVDMNTKQRRVLAKIHRKEKDYSRGFIVPNSGVILLLDDQNNIIRRRLKDGRVLQRIEPKIFAEITQLQWDEKNKQVYLSSRDLEGPIVLNLKNAEMQKLIPPSGYSGLSTIKNGIAAVVNGDKIEFWDIKSKTLWREMNKPSEAFINQMLLSPSGEILYVLDREGDLFALDVKGTNVLFQLAPELVSESTAFALSPNGSLLALSCSFDKEFRIVDAKNGSLIKTIKNANSFSKLPPIPNADAYMKNMPNSFKRNGNWYTPSNSSSNAGALCFTSDSSLAFHDFFSLSQCEIYDEDMLKRSPWSDYMYGSVASSGNGKLIALSRFEEVFDYQKEQDLLQYAIEIWDTENMKLMKVLEGHASQINDLVMNHNGSLLVSSSKDGTVKLWNLDEGRMVWNVSLANENNYIISSPDAYYSATQSAFRNIAFRKGDKVLAPESFELRYHRPDTILQMMGFANVSTLHAMKKAWVHRVNRSGYQPEFLSTNWEIPEMTLQTELLSEQDEKFITLQFEAYDSAHPLKSWNLYVNGCPEFPSSGNPISKKHQAHLEKTIELNHGMNTISFSCMNSQGIKSVSTPIQINYHQKNAEKIIHLFTIGVANYQDSTYNLKYPEKDARDILNLSWEASFDSIDRLQNHGELAIVEQIEPELKKLESVGVDDVVIIFLAGHGLLDNEFNFYFATYDCDFENPKGTAMPYTLLEEALWNCPSRKILVMLDACHSGEVDPDMINLTVIDTSSIKPQFRGARVISKNALGVNNSIDYMKQLFIDLNYGSGAQVIAAASGEGYALESDEWQNGIFTYAVIQAFRDKAADTNKDRKLSVEELKTYVFEMVDHLSNGKQKPTVRSENSAYDFTIH
jgi:WD40 repeat protein